MIVRPAGERPVPHQPCPACGAPAFVPHQEGCPWLVYSPPAWRTEPAHELTAAQVGLEGNPEEEK